MEGCKLCGNGNLKRYERKIWLGTMSAAEVAKMFQISESTLWDHLKNHVTQTKEEQAAVDDLATVLRTLAKKIEERVNDLLALPVDPMHEKDVAVQARLLKDVIMDVAKLEHQISDTPTIQIQNIMVQMNEIQAWLAENLCEPDKQKFTKWLESHIVSKT